MAANRCLMVRIASAIRLAFEMLNGAYCSVEQHRGAGGNVFFLTKISVATDNRNMGGSRKSLQRKGLRSGEGRFSRPQGVGRCPFRPAIYTVSTAPDFFALYTFEYPPGGDECRKRTLSTRWNK